MAKIKLKGDPIHTIGELPKVGSKAPDFRLTASDLSDQSLASWAGKRKILNIVPSLDTGVCAASARRFNELAGNMENTVVLTVSRDLPFAQERFCNAEGIKNVVTLSSLRDMNFGKDYGVEITDGPLAGILARAIVVLNEQDEVIYTELVPEIAQEPDYDRALEALKV
jgi:thiol peroxidase